MCRCRQVSQTRSKTYRLASVGILGKKREQGVGKLGWYGI